jgi:hypothetical protein
MTPIGLNGLHRSKPDGPMTTNFIGLIGPLLRRGPSFGPMREFAAPPRPNDHPARWRRCPTTLPHPHTPAPCDPARRSSEGFGFKARWPNSTFGDLRHGEPVTLPDSRSLPVHHRLRPRVGQRNTAKSLRTRADRSVLGSLWGRSRVLRGA